MPLEDLEKELYSQEEPRPEINLKKEGGKPFVRPAPLAGSKVPGPTEEEKIVEKEPFLLAMTRKFSRNLLIFLIIGVVILTGVVGWLFWHSPGPEEIVFKISGPTEPVMIGVPFELKAEISNNSNSALKTSKIIINLPEGVAELGHTPEEQATISRYLGDVSSSEISEQTFSLVALSGERTVKEFKAIFIFTTPGLGAEFERGAKFEVNFTEPALYLDIRTPQKVISG